MLRALVPVEPTATPGVRIKSEWFEIMDSLPVDAIRHIVLATLGELKAAPADGTRLEERLLRRDPTHLGCRFQYDSIRAVWFADNPAIEFFNQDGQFLKSVPVDRESLVRAA
mgnify:CR=1 FL=1